MIVSPNNTIQQTDPFSLSGRRLRKYNLLKYRMLSAILDYMATMNGPVLPGMHQPEAFDERHIYNMLGTGILSENKYRIADYNRILADMCYAVIDKSLSEVSSVVEYMRFNEWFGMGDSLAAYPEDSILYYGLGIDGMSISQVIKEYGPFCDVRYDTVRYGMGQYYYGEPILYPITFNRPCVPLIRAEWNIHDDIFMTVYFERHNDSTFAIYGYQFDKSQINIYE